MGVGTPPFPSLPFQKKMRCLPLPFHLIYLEVIWQEQFAGPEEAEDVPEDLPVPIDEVVLLQAVQHDGLRAIKQPADSAN